MSDCRLPIDGEPLERIARLEAEVVALARTVRSLSAKLAAQAGRVVEATAALERYGMIAAETSAAYRKRGRAARPQTWGLRHDYVGDWNALAEQHGWRRAQGMTPRRAALLHTREREETWDWPAIVRALDGVDHAWLRRERWWTFDRLVTVNGKGELTHVMVLEGAYDKGSPGTFGGDDLPEVSE